MPIKKKAIVIDTAFDDATGTVVSIVKPRCKALTAKQSKYLSRVKDAIQLSNDIYDGLYQRDCIDVHGNLFGDLWYCWDERMYPEPKYQNAEAWFEKHMLLLDMLLAIGYMNGIFQPNNIAGFL